MEEKKEKEKTTNNNYMKRTQLQKVPVENPKKEK